MDVEEQAMELEALAAIYGEDAKVYSYGTDSRISIRLFPINEIELDDNATGDFKDFVEPLCVEVVIPPSYPSQQCPVATMSASWISRNDCQDQSEVASTLRDLFVPGQCVLIEWLDSLRNRDELWQAPIAAARKKRGEDAARGRQTAEDKLSPQTEETKWVSEEVQQTRKGTSALTIIHGDPLTERKSTFQAHLARVDTPEQVSEMIAKLLENSKIARATHPAMMAYRIQLSETGTFAQDCDDDGESAAGGRLLHLLQVVDARNVCIIVSRWFGGTLLGPDRFKYINNVARDLLEQQGFIQRRK